MRDRQILRVREIASGFENLKCVECAGAIQDYLVSQGIPGKRIKLYTGTTLGQDSYIYDDSVSSGEAISVNGRHEAIVIIINEVEIVFDNHHPNGLPRNEWMVNLLFCSKLYYGEEFKITQENF